MFITFLNRSFSFKKLSLINLQFLYAIIHLYILLVHRNVYHLKLTKHYYKIALSLVELTLIWYLICLAKILHSEFLNRNFFCITEGKIERFNFTLSNVFNNCWDCSSVCRLNRTVNRVFDCSIMTVPDSELFLWFQFYVQNPV